MQRSLCESHAGLKAELLQRPAAPGEPTLTLMETYTLEPLGIGAALQARIEAEAQAALARWIEGPRHTEVFAACA
jgi:hypothetical protein